ncbi:hypothetical protein ACFP2T_37855 [Plantactinospora solaniradicis]|uniref:Uncharacterized protein n=1 Tax=Plantactinospora solaniradicis TaxID=1723736 RepID=A0ABW1KJF0_9ACTN
MHRSTTRHVAVLGVILTGVLLALVPPGAAPAVAAGSVRNGPEGRASIAALAAQHAPQRHRLGVDGIGPYRIGVSTLAGLTRRGLVTDVQEEPTCTGYHAAAATGRYADKLLFKFEGELLVQISTTDPTILTRDGGRVGLTLADLAARYGSRGEIVNGKWWLRAFLVPVGTRVIAFFEDPYTPYVYRVSSGERERVLASFTGGDDQC